MLVTLLKHHFFKPWGESSCWCLTQLTMAPWDRKSDSLETNNTMEIHDGKHTMETILVPFWKKANRHTRNIKSDLRWVSKGSQIEGSKISKSTFCPTLRPWWSDEALGIWSSRQKSGLRISCWKRGIPLPRPFNMSVLQKVAFLSWFDGISHWLFVQGMMIGILAHTGNSGC